ncbi:hypothetical protein [Mesorhizobium comanense]|uniref:hypothetical protein n=1 Tax=Mesorhizobium comanense TaxID=2502215 RepID=UPI0010F6434E|nr:hypothetical protein [Mesorhizobium comanense]
MDTRKNVVSASLSLSATNKIGKVLGLTVRGEEAEANWRVPRISYSVNRVLIHFEAEGCTFPEEDWAYDPVTLTDVEFSHENSETTEVTNNTDFGWAGSITASIPGGSVKSSRSRAEKKTTVSVTKFLETHKPILAHGTASNPTWSLTSERAHKPLLGTLIRHDRFCRAEPNGPKAIVRVSFEIPYDALLFRRPDGSYSGNKFGVARLLIRKSICGKRTALCEMEI